MDWLLRGGYGHPAPVEEEIAGATYELNTEDLIDFCLLYEGSQQGYVSRYFANRIGGRPAIFWDIGANVGSVSLAVAALSPQVRVFSFEPSPPVFARLSKNISLNPDLNEHVRVRHCALSDTTGHAEFFVSNELVNSGVGGLAHSHNRVGAGVSVEATRGDDLISAGTPGPDFIKIDVEGFELEVFRGLHDWLVGHPNVELLFEHSPYRFRERSQPIRCVVDLLQGWGFELRMMDGKVGSPQPHPVTAEDLEKHCDLVARRSF
jgi:FkbM family methyltransferase